MRFTILASGSKGNAAVVESNGYRLLIDCGLSLRELARRLAVVGLSPADLNALLITHLHSDHIKGVPTLLQKNPIPLFSQRTFRDIPLALNSQKIKQFDEFNVGPFTVVALPLPHDEEGSLGFIISSNSKRLVYATDFGYPTEELALALQSADAAIIESNHDLEMLDTCSYPDFIKERIRSEYGHLSNCQSAKLLSDHLSPQCQHVVLAHLSEKANHPAHALAYMRHSISHSVSVASQLVPTDWFDIESFGGSNSLILPKISMSSDSLPLP